MRKLLTLCIALAAIVGISASSFGGSMTLLGVGKPPGGGGACSQATTFLARTSGLSGTETTVYTNLICGLVTDGIITGTMAGAGPGTTGCGSVLDSLYWLATNTATTGKLNLCGTSFGLTETGTGTWTADGGYNSVSSSFLNTNYVPSTAGGAMTLNSASLGAYVTTDAGDFNSAIGATNGSGNLYIQPYSSGGASGMNDGTFSGLGATTAVGDWVLSRNSSTTYTIDRNGMPTSASPATATTNSFVSFALYISAQNNGGTVFSITQDRIISAFYGGGLTPGQRTAIATRLNTACTAMSITGC